jgi:hypothetical protein
MTTIASWNVCGLPKFVNCHRKMNDMYRQCIIDKLKFFKEVHIICLQEVFDNCLLKLIKKEMCDYSIISIRTKGMCLFSSGLAILVKKDYNVCKKEFVPYNTCCGEDCFANKGFLHVTLDNFHIINTHLNNDQPYFGKSKSLSVGENQVTCLNDYATKLGNVVIAGDFNRSAEFLIPLFPTFKGFTISKTYEANKKGESPNIDHIITNFGDATLPTIHELKNTSDHSLIIKIIQLPVSKRVQSFNMCNKRVSRKRVKRKKRRTKRKKRRTKRRKKRKKKRRTTRKRVKTRN